MTTWANDFEEGAAAGGNGIAITPANSAGTGETAFATVFTNLGSATYSTAQVAHGNYSAKLALSSFTDDAALSYNLGSSPSQLWFCIYLYFTALPVGSNLSIIGSPIYPYNSFLLLTTGTLYMNAFSGGGMTGSVQVALNHWIRVEGFVLLNASTGQMEYKLFNNTDSVTPDETLTSPASWTTGTTWTQYPGFLDPEQQEQSISAMNVYVDYFAVSDTGYIGPIGGAPLALPDPPIMNVYAPTWHPCMDLVTSVPGGIPFVGPPLTQVIAPVLPGTNTSATATQAGTGGGGTGSWVNPDNADGPSDGSDATWTAP